MNRRRRQKVVLLLAAVLPALLLCFPAVARAVWSGPAGGSADYLTGSYWQDGIIDDTFSNAYTLTGNLTLTLTADRTTAADLTFAYNEAYNLALTAVGGSRSLHLSGNVAVASTADLRQVTIGGGAYPLSVHLDGDRTFTVGANDVLVLANGISNGSTPSGITKAGIGTLVLAGDIGYTGVTHVSEGSLELSGSNHLHASSALVLDAANQARFDMKGFSDAVGSLSGGGNGYGNVLLGSGGSVTVGSDNTSTVYSGIISGSNGKVTKTGSGMLTLSNSENKFSGGLTVNGGTLSGECNFGSAAFTIPAASLDSSSASSLGAGPLLIDGNGAEIRLGNTYSGTATVAMQRDVAFGQNGGLLRFTGQNASGTGFSVVTGTAGAVPAVIQYAAGWDPTQWNFNNSFQLNGRPLAGPLRLELGNGAIATVSGNTSFAPPLTIRGVAGGNPAAATADFTVGRLGLTGGAGGTLNVPGGLTIEHAVQVSIAGGSHALAGNITLAPGARVGFQGLSTNSSDIYAPLVLGTSNDTLVINDGAEANIDARFRSEQSYHGGVRLEAKTDIKPGGILRFTQSYTDSAQTGFHQIDGDIRGEGTSGKEAVVDVLLGNKTANGGTTGGINWNTGTAKLVVNGSGTGGLRLQGAAVRLADMLGAGNSSRLQTVSGAGGYLTIAPNDTTYTLPAASEWSNTDVGLKVVDSAAGADVSLANYPAWNRNLCIDAGATLAVAGDGTTFAGILMGNGAISGGPVILSGTHVAGTAGPLGAAAVSLADGAILYSDVASPTSAGLSVTSTLAWQGHVTKSGSGAYTLEAAGSTVTVAPQSSLTINDGTLTVSGTANPLGSGSDALTLVNNSVASGLDIAGSVVIAALTGTGNITVETGARLAVGYIQQHRLSLSPGATVILGFFGTGSGIPWAGPSAFDGNALDDVPADAGRLLGATTPLSDTAMPTPEPGAWVQCVLVMACALICCKLRRFSGNIAPPPARMS